MKIKPRNAGAVAAWFKTGSGLHNAKTPPRVKSVEFGFCDDCGAALDEGDESELCIDCEDQGEWDRLCNKEDCDV